MTKPPSRFGSTEDQVLDERRATALARPFLFVVLHADSPAQGGARYCLSDLDQVDIGRGPLRSATRVAEGRRRKLDLRLPSTTVSKVHGRLFRKGDAWHFEDLDSRNGSYLNGTRLTHSPLKDGDFLEIGSVFLRYRSALPTSPGAEADLDLLATEATGFVTLVPPLAAELGMLARVALAPITVLLLGESGTGKEVLGHGIHALSGRAGAFVPVNCGALTASLLESQLFGHTKGAFTGAIRDEPGYIRRATGGTLFLDEIGDLPLSAQATLLRVLEAREVVPVGATVPILLDLRVVAATHKPLDRMAIRGAFRVDLLARLSGHQHTLMPLRQRIEDLGLLIRDLLRRSEVPGAADLRISVPAARWLVSQRWPLNIRGLSQVLGVAAALAEGPLIERSFLLDKDPKAIEPSEEASPADPEDLRGRIVSLLEKHKGNVSYVARDMGKARVQIHRWMQKLEISADEYRS